MPGTAAGEEEEKRDSSTAGWLVPILGTKEKRAGPPLRMTVSVD